MHSRASQAARRLPSIVILHARSHLAGESHSSSASTASGAGFALSRPEVPSQRRCLSMSQRARFRPLPPDLSLQDRQALLALRRAVTEDDPLGRVSAIWDAIEFYVAGTAVPALFTRDELKA